ncbi:MAG: hypothetical protein F6K30_17185 [Cyanothece sp. SIO2G6]|nr:hypothetical protein [Cyanothece sp. SIO2G6]
MGSTPPGGILSDRLNAFPHWQNKPPVQQAEGDLIYPDWFEGTWQMTSTLVEMVAPLAPEVVTPGFEGNRQFLQQPITNLIRFVPARVGGGRFLGQLLKTQEKIVSDRAFNGLNLARAYLGEDGVVSVKVDPDNPNRQITLLKGNQQLVSTVTGRNTEAPTPYDFVTTEVFQQFFGGNRPTVYLNEVENTTAYHFDFDSVDFDPDSHAGLTANQITAIYLSPQDPDYFKALNHPVALYRYQLTFQRAMPE